MNAPQQNLITAVARDAKIVLNMDGQFIQHDILCTMYDNDITQEEIDSVPAFLNAGLTVANLASVVYILKMLHVQMNTDLPSMVMMANL